MFSIRHPVRTWFGAATVEKIRDEAEFTGAKRALVFTDKGVREAGIADKAIEPLKSVGVDVTVYDECTPEPAIVGVDPSAPDFSVVVRRRGWHAVCLFIRPGNHRRERRCQTQRNSCWPW